MARRMSILRMVIYLVILSTICSILLGVDVILTYNNDSKALDPKKLELDNLVPKTNLLNPVRSLVQSSSEAPNKITDKSKSEYHKIFQNVEESDRTPEPKDMQTKTTSPSDSIIKSRFSPKINDIGIENLNKVMKFIPNIMPVIQEPKQPPKLYLPDDPNDYFKHHKVKEQQKFKQQEVIEDSQSRREKIIPHVFDMLHLINQKQPDVKKKNYKYFDLSKKAAEEGNIGPFSAESRRIDKALKSYDASDETVKKIESRDKLDETLHPITVKEISERSTDKPKIISDKSQDKEKITKPIQVSSASKKKTTARKKQPGVLHDIDRDEVSLTDSEIQEYMAAMYEMNDLEEIHNLDQFEPFTANATIILIQVIVYFARNIYTLIYSINRYMILIINLISHRYTAGSDICNF